MVPKTRPFEPPEGTGTRKSETDHRSLLDDVSWWYTHPSHGPKKSKKGQATRQTQQANTQLSSNSLSVSVVEAQSTDLTGTGTPNAEAGSQFTVLLESKTSFAPGDATVSADLHYNADMRVAAGTVVLVKAQTESITSGIVRQEGATNPKAANKLLVDAVPYNKTGNFGGKPNQSGYITFRVTDASGSTRIGRLDVNIKSIGIPGGLPAPSGALSVRSVVPIPNTQ